MPRKKTWGTPGGRSERYFFPRPWYPRLLLGLVLGGAVVGMLLLLQVTGAWVSPLRDPLMPAPLSEVHSTVANCEACHAWGRGVSNFRCQRCHDESGPGRRTLTAHVGRHVPRAVEVRAPAEAEPLACVNCHVEHRGREAALSVVGDASCAECHAATREDAEGPRPRIASFDDHPEFRVVRADEKAKGAGGRIQQVTGLLFSHAVHVKEARKSLRGATGGMRACQECHKIEGGMGGAGRREFAPVTFEADCLGCHEDQLMTEAAPQRDLVMREGRAVVPFACDPKLFSCAEGVVKNTVIHRDPWVLLNLRKLRRELYPAEHAREYASLLSRAAWLRRRLFLAGPLAVLTPNELGQRKSAFTDDLRKLDTRIQSRSGAAPDPTGGRARLDEVVRAAAAAQDPGLEALRAQIAALADVQPTGAVSTADFEERRDELLRLLDAVAASESADSRRRFQAAYLRLRVLSLVPGEPALEGLRRAHRQREQDVARVEDEMSLRHGGIPPLGNPDKGLREVEAALAEIQARLQELKAVEVFPEAAPEERGRKEAALRALAGEADVSGCAKCHEIKNGTLAPVTASRRVLTLADFRHEPHLTAIPPDPSLWRRLLGSAKPASGPMSCASCHPGVEKSAQASDLHLQPISGCRECHGPQALRQDCQLCHRYHPPSRL